MEQRFNLEFLPKQIAWIWTTIELETQVCPNAFRLMPNNLSNIAVGEVGDASTVTRIRHPLLAPELCGADQSDD